MMEKFFFLLHCSRLAGRREEKVRGDKDITSANIWKVEQYRSKLETQRNINFLPGSCLYTPFLHYDLTC